MKYLVILAAITAVASADVVSGSLHRADMQELDAVMNYTYTADVVCATYDGSDDISVRIYATWAGSTYQFEQLGYSIAAIGMFTERTSWRSGYAMILYSDLAFICTTSAARNLANNVPNWTNRQIEQWITLNLISQEI